MAFHILFVLTLGIFLLFITYYNRDNKVLLAVSTFVFLFFSVSLPFLYFDTLSRPKALAEEYLRNDKETPVLNFVVKPGVGLYVLLDLKGIKEPRYYKVPWNENTKKVAEELQKGMKNKQKMVLKLPFEKSLEKDRPLTAHPIPQLAPPPKQNKPRTNIPEYRV